MWGKGHEHDLQTSDETTKDTVTIMAADNWEVKGTGKEMRVLLHWSYVCVLPAKPVPPLVARALLHLFLSCIIQSSGCSCCVAGPPFAASATIYVDPEFCWWDATRSEGRRDGVVLTIQMFSEYKHNV